GRRIAKVVTDGPDVLLSTSGGTGAGQTLTVTALVFNTGGPATADALGWIGLPTGQVITLFDIKGVTIPTAASNSPVFNGPIFSRTFTGSEPSGLYVVGIRFTDTVLRETLVLQTATISK